MPTKKRGSTRKAKAPPEKKAATPDEAMATLVETIAAINQSRGVRGGFAAPMFASLVLASRCTGKASAPVDFSRYLADNSPDDGACRENTSLFRSTERNSTGCHRSGCAYATGSAWLPSVLGEYCTSCDTFLTEANGEGKTAALIRFFWFSAISINGHADASPCVAQEDLLDLAFALFASRGEAKAIRYCLDFDEAKYDAVIKSKAFREGVAELRGEYTRYQKAGALVALAAIVGAAVYLHRRDDRGLQGAWQDVSAKLSDLYSSATGVGKKKRKRGTPSRKAADHKAAAKAQMIEWESDILARKDAKAASKAADRKVIAEVETTQWESDILARRATAAARRQTMARRRDDDLRSAATAERRRRSASAKASINADKQEHARRRRASAPAPPARGVTSYSAGQRAADETARAAIKAAIKKDRKEHWGEETWRRWINRNARKLGLDPEKGMTLKEKVNRKKRRRELEAAVAQGIRNKAAGAAEYVRRSNRVHDQLLSMFNPGRVEVDDNFLRRDSGRMLAGDRPLVAPYPGK